MTDHATEKCVGTPNNNDSAADAACRRNQMGHVLWKLTAWIDSNKFYAHFPVEVRFVQRDTSGTLLSLSPDSDVCFINILMYRLNGCYLLVVNAAKK